MVVLNRIKDALQSNIHVEISIPVYPDSDVDEYDNIIDCIGKNIKIPIHLLKIIPVDKSSPVDDNILFDIRKRFLKKLEFVYIHGIYKDANIKNTYCPSCGSLVIERLFRNEIKKLDNMYHCKNCNYDLNIVGY